MTDFPPALPVSSGGQWFQGFPLLPWLAAKLPRRILPDDMTALGVLAAFGVCAAYQLTNEDSSWLWAAPS